MTGGWAPQPTRPYFWRWMMIPIARPMLGEEEMAAVREVLESGQLTQGAKVRQFEENFAAFIGCRHAVAVANGTAALFLALTACGISCGDEVITSPFSFVATANMIQATGAKPVFVDIDPATYCLDSEGVEKVSGRRQVRAILPVHLYGHPANLTDLRDIAERKGLLLIEDAAQAHGASWQGQRIGSTGTACWSFYATKNMTTGEGGMVTTDDNKVAEQVRLLREHGSRTRYHHEQFGWNLRMTEIQAAIGIVQLAKLPAMNERRIRNAAYLNERLAGISGLVLPTQRPEALHVYHQYTLRVTTDFRLARDVLKEKLTSKGVGTSVHYPLPIHRQPNYVSEEWGRFPKAEQAASEVLSLPVHPSLSEDDLAKIADEVTEAAYSSR